MSGVDLWWVVAEKKDFFVIAGPCVMESYDLMEQVALTCADVCRRLGVTYIFKSSYDKANRTSISSFRGPGIKKGLQWLAKVKEKLSIPVLTDVHSPREAMEAAAVADVLQIPAFLCRQTDLVVAVARTGRIVNIKKGQFLAPWDVRNVVEKITVVGNKKILLTERGTCFGYNTLVVDMCSIPVMRQLGYPVVFDATHSVQKPGGMGGCSGGNREFVPYLARAAVAAGADGVFLEVHPDPDQALCDGPNSWPLREFERLLVELVSIFSLVRDLQTEKGGKELGTESRS